MLGHRRRPLQPPRDGAWEPDQSSDQSQCRHVYWLELLVALSACRHRDLGHLGERNNISYKSTPREHERYGLLQRTMPSSLLDWINTGRETREAM